jgi:hypothetical protein
MTLKRDFPRDRRLFPPGRLFPAMQKSRGWAQAKSAALPLRLKAFLSNPSRRGGWRYGEPDAAEHLHLFAGLMKMKGHFGTRFLLALFLSHDRFSLQTAHPFRRGARLQ